MTCWLISQIEAKCNMVGFVVDGHVYSTDQRKGKHIPRAIPTSYPRSIIFLAVGAMRATRARGSKHTGDGNQFMSVVELPKGTIIELELRIDKKPTNMRTKVLIEAELFEQVDKYLYSSYK